MWVRRLLDHRATLIFVGLLICLCVTLGFQAANRENGPETRERILARSFVVVDKDGKERGSFGDLGNDKVGLVVWDQEKRNFVTLAVDGKGTFRLSFQNDRGASLLDLGVLDMQVPALVMQTPEGKRRIGMVVSETGTAGIILYDTLQRERLAVKVGPAGEPQLSMKDAKGRTRAAFVMTGDDCAALTLLDSHGNERVLLQVDDDGEPHSVILTAEGRIIWSAKAGDPVLPSSP